MVTLGGGGGRRNAKSNLFQKKMSLFCERSELENFEDFAFWKSIFSLGNAISKRRLQKFSPAARHRENRNI